MLTYLETLLLLFRFVSTGRASENGISQLPLSLADIFNFIEPESGSESNTTNISRLQPRQDTTCNTPCSWITQTETCKNVTCDCQIISQAGPAGVGNCANCLEPLNATLATEAVQVGEYCGITAIALTFTIASTSTSSPRLTSFSGASVVTITTTTTPPFFTLPISIEGTMTSPSFSTTTGPTQSSTLGSNGLSGGAIGGIVCGILGTFIILAGFMIWWIRRRGARQSGGDEPVVSISSQPIPKFVETGISSLTPAGEDVHHDVVSGRLRYPEFLAEETPAKETVGARLSRGY
jgi:hypothetical protein